MYHGDVKHAEHPGFTFPEPLDLVLTDFRLASDMEGSRITGQGTLYQPPGREPGRRRGSAFGGAQDRLPTRGRVSPFDGTEIAAPGTPA